MTDALQNYDDALIADIAHAGSIKYLIAFFLSMSGYAWVLVPLLAIGYGFPQASTLSATIPLVLSFLAHAWPLELALFVLWRATGACKNIYFKHDVKVARVVEEWLTVALFLVAAFAGHAPKLLILVLTMVAVGAEYATKYLARRSGLLRAW